MVIAAIATARGEGAVSVVRASGEGCVAMADAFFSGSLAGAPPRYMKFGRVAEKRGGRAIASDEVLAVRFEAGRSYTGEESVEIHCHGGHAAAERCLSLFLSNGARIAEPGEFTKRAFLSGRIDLAQAESVQSVIRAKSCEALESSCRSLGGELSSRMREVMDELNALRASIEVRMDYPEEVDGQEIAEISRGISEIGARAAALLDRCRVGMALSNGLVAAIAGPPNAGKSSLLNALVGFDRSIVTDAPGTTRDTVSARFIWRGLEIEFIDTAGIRGASDEAERIGVNRARAALRAADVRVIVVDSSMPANRSVYEELTNLPPKPTIIALSKRDLASYKTDGALSDILGANIIGSPSVIETSAVTGRGIEALKDAIFELAAGGAPADESYAATERITSAIESAAALIDEAGRALYAAGADAAGSLLSEAAAAISEQLGVDASEELLDEIFSTFCVGK
ncbi:tRNA modification GTPase MnmE [Synergistales bacterium]|nr:tRNA modification GTPase MnmE [Synergistales bacterium]